MQDANELVRKTLKEQLLKLESHFNADFISLTGQIFDGYEKVLLHVIEQLKKRNNTLYFILTTTGGSATAVERFVNILRYNYKIVNFIIPDYAYSAGTIFCMSGDDIYMDYYSVLGPIDPQVRNKEGKYVPALGYLDKVNELIEKARDGVLTDAEFLILKEMDLGELRSFEQAKELTIDLLKKWLVKYKFKNWNVHETNPDRKGKKVTITEKRERAEQIADKLSDNKRWKSHGRPINIEELNELQLKIYDYSNEPYRKLIRDYYELLSDYIMKNRHEIFIHTREFI
ncbi:serine dehydrogenase proteinase [bacterium BMS3Abin04]|nr:serine dehydrogenase proteinase [bacterium BMS3Abin04]